MKWTILLTIAALSFGASAQRTLDPRKSKKMFGGPQSYKDYSLNGIQFQVGATTLLNRLNNPTEEVDFASAGFRGNYTFDPISQVGAYAEIGMFHFPKNFPKLKISKKKSIVLISYYDWGIGFKYFRGAEDLTVNNTDILGNVVSTDEQRSNFTNGNVYGRFSIHKLNYFHSKKRGGDKINFFLDHSLGFNFDYRVLQTSDEYNYAPLTNNQQYYKPFYAQLHYGLGFGFSPRRGMFIVPGVRLPILGYHATTAAVGGDDDVDSYFGKPSMHWFSSRYWPLMMNVKFMWSLPKREKGCRTGITNDQDKETQRGR